LKLKSEEWVRKIAQEQDDILRRSDSVQKYNPLESESESDGDCFYAPLLIAAGHGTTGTHLMHEATCSLGFVSLHHSLGCFPESAFSTNATRIKWTKLHGDYPALLKHHKFITSSYLKDPCIENKTPLSFISDILRHLENIIAWGKEHKVALALHDSPYPLLMPSIIKLVKKYYGEHSQPIILSSERGAEEWTKRRAEKHGDYVWVCRPPNMTMQDNLDEVSDGGGIVKFCGDYEWRGGIMCSDRVSFLVARHHMSEQAAQEQILDSCACKYYHPQVDEFHAATLEGGVFDIIGCIGNTLERGQESISLKTNQILYSLKEVEQINQQQLIVDAISSYQTAVREKAVFSYNMFEAKTKTSVDDMADWIKNAMVDSFGGGSKGCMLMEEWRDFLGLQGVFVAGTTDEVNGNKNGSLERSSAFRIVRFPINGRTYCANGHVSNMTRKIRLEATENSFEKSTAGTSTERAQSHQSSTCKESKTGGVMLMSNGASLPNKPGMIKVSFLDTIYGTSRSDTSYCQINERCAMRHFPHYLQYILRCFSFFQSEPHKHLVISTSGSECKGTSWKNYSPLEAQSVFQRGINQLLVDYGISIEPSTTVEPYFGRGDNSSSVIVNIDPLVGNWGKSDSFWMESPEHAREFRRHAISRLNLVQPTSASTSQASCNDGLPRIAILNRQDKKRSLLNADSIAQALKDEFKMEKAPPVVYFENATFSEQVKFFYQTDILLSPHGAQLTGIPFMPNNGAVLEFFPKGWTMPQYFGALCTSSGIDYAYIGETESGNLGEETRLLGSVRGSHTQEEAKSTRMCIPVSQAVEGVKALVTRWRQRCNANMDMGMGMDMGSGSVS
jgi:hypothetical protein